jgi:hypothetical protein
VARETAQPTVHPNQCVLSHQAGAGLRALWLSCDGCCWNRGMSKDTAAIGTPSVGLISASQAHYCSKRENKRLEEITGWGGCLGRKA